MHRLLLRVQPQRFAGWPSGLAALSSAPQRGQQDWRQVVADFQRQAGDTSTPLLPKDVTDTVLACTTNNRTNEALDVLRRAERRGVNAPLWAHVQVCCSMARKGQTQRAFERMKELHERFEDEFQDTQSSVYDPLLSVFKVQADSASAHTAIAQMNELGITPQPRAFRVLMLTAAKARRKDTLLATISFLEGKFPDVWKDIPTLTAMCQALVDVGDPQHAMKIYWKLDADWLHEQAPTMLYNQFLLAAARSNDSGNTKATKRGKRAKKSKENDSTETPTATRIFEHMRASNSAVPDDFTYATYIMYLEKHGEHDQVLELFSSMLDVDAKNKSSSSEPIKSVINPLACSTVIRALHKRSEAEQQAEPDAQETGSPTKSTKKLSPQQRKLKQDLSVVLKQLRTANLQNIGHASTLVDTLDEFRLFTPARQVFQRMLDEGVIRETPWRQKDGFEIDLHTFSRGVAKCAVVSAFGEITRLVKEGHPGNVHMQNLRIITGVGNRSQVFLKPVLKQEISDMLKNACRPQLWPSTHPTNPGVLVLRHNRLRKWIEKGGVMRYF